MPDSKVFFKFDSARLAAGSKERLREIADCATTGAAKGRDLIVVGHTDPVGTDAYNQQLGMSRAESVSSYLKAQGLTGTRIETRSRGEAGAAADSAGWPYDRRVSLRLQD
jgi:outer membrane protein OmpA-like peptidoglycan-associated protein